MRLPTFSVKKVKNTENNENAAYVGYFSLVLVVIYISGQKEENYYFLCLLMLTKRKLIRLGFHSLDQMFVLQTDLWQSCEEKKNIYSTEMTLTSLLTIFPQDKNR
jgi:hypothetical protein